MIRWDGNIEQEVDPIMSARQSIMVMRSGNTLDGDLQRSRQQRKMPASEPYKNVNE
jgi:hypothetical protein